MTDWLTPASVVAACGGDSHKFIDGNVNSYWFHITNHMHWIELNLGARYNVTSVRIRRGSGTTGRFYGADLYVSEDGENWGGPIATNIDLGPVANSWKTVDCEDKVGRYMRLDDIDPDHNSNWLYAYEIQFDGELLDGAQSYSFVM